MDEDIKTLTEILESIKNILTWIVRDSGLIDSPLRALFLQVLTDTQQKLDSVTKELRAIPSEGDPRYKRLQEGGLTDGPLTMKAAVGRKVLREVSNSVVQSPEGPRILGIKLKKPLAWINSILGTLAHVFPILEAVKEYKEHVELAVEERQSEPAWGYKPIFDLK